MFKKIKGFLTKSSEETAEVIQTQGAPESQSGGVQISLNERLRNISGMQQTPEFLQETLQILFENGVATMKNDFESRRKAIEDASLWADDQMKHTKDAEKYGRENFILQRKNDIKYAAKLDIKGYYDWHCRHMDTCGECEDLKGELEALCNDLIEQLDAM